MYSHNIFHTHIFIYLSYKKCRHTFPTSQLLKQPSLNTALTLFPSIIHASHLTLAPLPTTLTQPIYTYPLT